MFLRMAAFATAGAKVQGLWRPSPH